MMKQEVKQDDGRSQGIFTFNNLWGQVCHLVFRDRSLKVSFWPLFFCLVFFGLMLNMFNILDEKVE